MPDYIVRKKCFISNMKKNLINKAFYSIEEHMNSYYSNCYEA